MAGKKGLGKGLDALFIDNSTSSGSSTERIRLTEIEPNRNQPRKYFEEEPLQQLADSIRENGLLQPLLVRPLPDGGYQLIAGERRWRACRMAGLSEVPVIVKDVDDEKTMELALIENLQRENLNPIEEALGYQELMESYHLTQADVSKSVGKSRSAVANTLRLLTLPAEVIDYVKDGSLSSGHARALLALEEEDAIRETAQRAIQQGLTVRDLERLSSQTRQKSGEKVSKVFNQRDSFYDEIELALKEELHRKVRICEDGGKGTLEVTFYSKEELADLAARLAGQGE